ncbi:MAG: ATP-binding protein [Candidatus Paceibacterota bacterium]
MHKDIGKTKQGIQNLVDNSMKYISKGSIKIFVHDNKRKKRIYVDVIDTGIGMSGGDRSTPVFDKFERAGEC